MCSWVFVTTCSLSGLFEQMWVSFHIYIGLFSHTYVSFWITMSESVVENSSPHTLSQVSFYTSQVSLQVSFHICTSFSTYIGLFSHTYISFWHHNVRKCCSVFVTLSQVSFHICMSLFACIGLFSHAYISFWITISESFLRVGHHLLSLRPLICSHVLVSFDIRTSLLASMSESAVEYSSPHTLSRYTIHICRSLFTNIGLFSHIHTSLFGITMPMGLNPYSSPRTLSLSLSLSLSSLSFLSLSRALSLPGLFHALKERVLYLHT